MLTVQKAFSFPFKDHEWPVKLLIGSVLAILPIVSFFANGYAYNIFKRELRREEPILPEWDNWGDLFVQGFLIFAIEFIYMIIPLLFVIFGSVLLFGTMSDLFLRDYLVSASIAGAMFLGAGILLFFAVVFISPMAICNYAKYGEDFSAAFKLWEIIPNISRVFGDYLIAFVLIFALVVVMLMFCMIPYLGLLFVIAFSFYVYYLVPYSLFGMACAEVYGKVRAPHEGRT